jgi:hypothetical protein
VQGLAAALALGAGPLHRHDSAAVRHEHRHEHRHDHAERHHHPAHDGSVLIVADPAFDAAAFAITAALALMAVGAARVWAATTRRHVWHAAPAWAWSPILPLVPLKPPRRA